MARTKKMKQELLRQSLRQLPDEVDLFRSEFVIVAHRVLPLLPIHEPRVAVVAPPVSNPFILLRPVVRDGT